MSLIRDSFAGINARFHLAGAYTLVVLLMSITLTVLSEEPEWFGLIMLTTMFASGIFFGILGITYHAAAGREGDPSFPRYAMTLFLPLVWLQIRLVFLTYSPIFVVLWGFHAATASQVPLEEWMATSRFWIEPFASLGILVLSLYSTPLCIYHREKEIRGAPIRQGLTFYRGSPHESWNLLALLGSIAVLGGTAHYMHGPVSKDLVPSIPEGLLLFAISYLSLVAFFGATRVVMGRTEPVEDRPASAADSNELP